MKWGRVIPIALALSACGSVPPALHAGYDGWWPAGFGYAPVTARALHHACTVTVYGPTLPRSARSVMKRSAQLGIRWKQRYGGVTTCRGPVRQKSLLIAEEVRGRDNSWWTIVGSTFTARSATGGPLRASRARPAVLRHAYRAVAHAVLVVPDRHARCSAGSTAGSAAGSTAGSSCSKTVVVTAISPVMPAEYP